jgi:putative ABC transport system ATP-binding protein
VLKIDDLTFHYAGTDFRLTAPELGAAAGEKIAVIGPSGSGKTTLLNLIAGILVSEHGQVRLGDVPVQSLSDRERRHLRSRRIGFVFQDFALLDYLTVLDNILHPFRISRALRLNREVRSRARDLAVRMGIRDQLSRYPGALSQGEKQRAAICRTLLPRPKLILADEATGNLDPDNKQRILDLLFEAVAREDAALLAVTHDHELLPYFDRVVDFKGFSGPAA